jgi:hypothetical protein
VIEVEWWCRFAVVIVHKLTQLASVVNRKRPIGAQETSKRRSIVNMTMMGQSKRC